MKMNISNNSIDKLVIHSKIFQSLKVPERNKRLNDLQKNVIKLRNSIGLLNTSKEKRKINRKKAKKALLINPITNSMIKNLNEEKKIKKFASLENFIPYNESNIDSIGSNQIKDRNMLYMDRASTLKRKNLKLLEKMKKNDNKDNSYKNLYNINKNELFITDSNLPHINYNNGNKHNSLRKVLTESNNYYENKINIINNNKQNINDFNKKLNNIIIRSNSDKKMLPPIRLKKENLLTINNDRNKNDLIKNESSDLNDSKDINLSFLDNNTEEKNDNEKNININKNNNNKNINITIEAERKIPLRKKISNLNNKVIDIFGSYTSRKKNNPEINNLITSVNKINKDFRNTRFCYELEKWIMSTKFKYADWKYGINDINKYFVNINEFGQKEEKELEMRKSFYEKVDSVINELKEDKEKRELLEIEHKYGIKLNKEEKKILKNNEYWMGDHAENKREEICKVLKLTKERKKKEKEKRNLIEEIMFQCKKGVNNINNL